jgi:hypothetical protein
MHLLSIHGKQDKEKTADVHKKLSLTPHPIIHPARPLIHHNYGTFTAPVRESVFPISISVNQVMLNHHSILYFVKLFTHIHQDSSSGIRTG